MLLSIQFASFDPSDAIHETTRNFFLSLTFVLPSCRLDQQESAIPNDFSLPLSPADIRRSGPPKRQRVSASGQLDYLNAGNNPSMVGLAQTTADSLSSNVNDDNNSSQRQRKLDPRSCPECGKILFNDKTLLLHCQTHAKNEKQCWICGTSDDDIKKHILTEHGTQKFTTTGFRVSDDVRSAAVARIGFFSVNIAIRYFPSSLIWKHTRKSTARRRYALPHRWRYD